MAEAPATPGASLTKALRAQVQAALRELLAGFDRANRASGGRLLPGGEEVYPALVSVILRMVFVLFAEEHGLLPLEGEALAGALPRLHAGLRRDLERHGRALDDRHGAWGQVTALFRRLHGGAPEARDPSPAGRARLFDPDRYPFLEGHIAGDKAPGEAPSISDGALRRTLDRLLLSGGERLSYRDLTVEHIGSAYEGLMGFEVRTAKGLCLTLQPDDAVADLDALAAQPPAERARLLADEAGLVLKGKVEAAVREASSAAELLAILTSRASPRCPDPILPGSIFLQPGEERRRFGAHYTSRALTRVVVERALAPLLRDDMTPEEVLSLAVCDPAMGSGAFLLEACRRLAAHLARAWERAARPPELPPGEDLVDHARMRIAERCLHGVDKDPLAVDLARLSLWLESRARRRPFTFVDHALRHGDSLLGLSVDQIAGVSLDGHGQAPSGAVRAGVEERLRGVNTPPLAGSLREADERVGPVRLLGDLLVAAALETGRSSALVRAAKGRRGGSDEAGVLPALRDVARRLLAGERVAEAERRAAEVRARHAPFHWQIELPGVFARGGFDAVLGNPPWVSYAGRAAQPLPEELRGFYLATSAAFAGYRNLQGIFVERAAAMLRPGGRLGLVLPTSMSDLGGYEPSRRAHDALCVCDESLPDFGDAFDDVFQPSMALLSTRRAARVPLEATGPWPLERRDLDPASAALLDRLSALPRLPPHLFGERGLQTSGDDVRRLRELPGPEGRFTTALRVGGDIEPFLRRPARLYCDPSELRGRLRPPEDWQSVRLLIRQTARVPIVTFSDGGAFRNSLLAGFEDAAHSAPLLLAYLGSAPVRWFHYHRHRDARQGMPQLKIAHLRAFPAPPPGAPERAAIERLGAELGARNTGITPDEQAHLDALVAAALGLDSADRARIAAWAAQRAPR